ncbi:CHAT domain-containing protein [Nostoc sphaeroides CCNUC1]|uniref:CHAT domain-containing protein n=2 Tax=Nostoc sphaeroides TaxID=446679 RepID=A0A5P8WCA3_9NOSO|nr:CHAT domain-containing protein [Nostoc sphaeroides CCNUC1]
MEGKQKQTDYMSKEYRNFKIALAIAQEIKDRQLEANALASLGSAYSSLEDYPKAIDYQEQSLAIALRVDSSVKTAEILTIYTFYQF